MIKCKYLCVKLKNMIFEKIIGGGGAKAEAASPPAVGSL